MVWSGHHYSIDGVVMFQYAKALLFGGSFKMEPPVRWGDDFVVSKWPIGLTLAYMPILAILSRTVFLNDPSIRRIPFDPDLRRNPELLRNLPYLFSSVLNPLITAATAVVLYWVCLQLGMSSKKAGAAALVFGLASPAAAYAKYDYAQPLASLLLLLAFLYLLKAQQGTIRYFAGTGFSMGAAILARPEFTVFAPVLAVALGFLPSKPSSSPKPLLPQHAKPILLFSLPVLAFVFLNQYINLLRFSSWSGVGYQPALEFTLQPERILTALLGNLVSPGRGLLLYFPPSLLALAGVRRLAQVNRWFAWTLSVFIACSLLLYAAWRDWGAGLSWGPRFFIPLMPYFTLLAFAGLGALQRISGSGGAFLFAGLVFLAWVAALQGVLFNFLTFYGRLPITQAIIDQGNYNFEPAYSPLFTGWQDLANPSGYDIFWLQRGAIEATGGLATVILLAGLVAFGFAVYAWLRFFLAPGPPAYEDRLA